MFHHELKRFGTILKTHGVQGELIVSVVSDIPEKFELPGAVFIVINGIPVPFFPEYYEVISDNSLKIKFDTICNREDAMRYYNLDVLADRKSVSRFFPKQKLFSVIGYVINDESGRKVGKVTEFDDIPGNPVVTVDNGLNKILLPVNEELIIEVDEKARILTLRIPEGLQ